MRHDIGLDDRTALARNDSSPLPQDRTSYRWVMLAFGAISQLGISFPGQGIAALAYFFQRDWALSRAEVGLLVSAIYLCGLFTGAAFGLLTDIIGVRRLVFIGLLLSSSSLLLVVLSNSLSIALLAVLPIGLGSSMSNPAISKVLMYWFPPKFRGTAMSIKQSGVPLAGAINAAALPALAIAFNWRVALVVLWLVVMACGIVSWMLYREAPQTAKLANASLRPSFRQVFRAVARRDVLLISVLQIPLCAAHFTAVGYLLLYFNEVLLFPVLAAGMLLSVAQLSGIAGRVFWGVVSDRLFRGSRRNTLVVLVVLEIATLVVLAMLPAGAPSGLVILLAVMVGMLTFGWQGVYVAHVGEMAPPNLVATFFGFTFSIGQLGIVLGPPLFGYIADHTGSYRIAWLILASSLLVTAALLPTVRERRHTATP